MEFAKGAHMKPPGDFPLGGFLTIFPADMSNASKKILSNLCAEKKETKMKKLTIVLGMILVVLVVSGFPCNSRGDSTIYGCYLKKTGALRIVSGPSLCKKSEISISWGATVSQIPNISGSWSGVDIVGEEYNPVPFTVTVTQTGSNISGTISSGDKSGPLNGTIDSLCRLSFTVPSGGTLEGGTFNGKISGDMMFGVVEGPRYGLMMGIGPQTTCP